jgi:hypothetical protein
VGRNRAAEWLEKNLSRVGQESTIDLVEEFF